MKIKCSIDNKSQLLDVNSHKPLNLILIEESGGTIKLSSCNSHLCGNCIVLLNDEAVLSCLIPAFQLKGPELSPLRGTKRVAFSTT